MTLSRNPGARVEGAHRAGSAGPEPGDLRSIHGASIAKWKLATKAGQIQVQPAAFPRKHRRKCRRELRP